MLPPLEYMERELRIAVRMKSALSLLIITRLSPRIPPGRFQKRRTPWSCCG